MKIRIAALIGTLLCSVTLTGCSKLSSLTVDSVPLPGSSNANGYDIVAEFANVLNLPDRAKVVMDGTKVGEVTKVAEAGTHVDVTARIQQGVAIPSNATAVLQQATVLGDIYLAVERPTDGSPSGAPLPADGPDSVGPDRVSAAAGGHHRKSGELHRQRVDPARSEHPGQVEPDYPAQGGGTPGGLPGHD